ncbi:hypothetical protein IW150_002254 [Coemansia sp. RSA 2607]|nr:hypothetical protein IW150_002254 [Coemansia sp. RSA 2607]
MVNLRNLSLVLGLPLLATAASTAPDAAAHSMASVVDAVEASPVIRASAQRRPPPPIPTATPQGYYDDNPPKASGTLPPASSSLSSYDYSFGVNLSGFDGVITHYYVSYSDPYVSGAVGVGPSDPTPTPKPQVTEGVVCDKKFPGLLSGIGLDLGLRLNLMLIGIDACIAL